MDLLPMHDFVTSCIHWSFGNYWFIELRVSSKSWHISLYTIKKITFVKISANFIRSLQILELVSCQAYSGGETSPKILIFTGWGLSPTISTPNPHHWWQCRGWKQGFRGVVGDEGLFFTCGPLKAGLLFHCHHWLARATLSETLNIFGVYLQRHSKDCFVGVFPPY